MPAASLGSSRIEATVRLAGMPAASRVAQPSGAKGGGADRAAAAPTAAPTAAAARRRRRRRRQRGRVGQAAADVRPALAVEAVHERVGGAARARVRVARGGRGRRARGARHVVARAARAAEAGPAAASRCAHANARVVDRGRVARHAVGQAARKVEHHLKVGVLAVGVENGRDGALRVAPGAAAEGAGVEHDAVGRRARRGRRRGGAGGAGGGEGEQSALHTWRHCTLIRWGLLVAYVFHHMLVYRPSPSGSLSPRVKHPGKKGSFVPPQPGGARRVVVRLAVEGLRGVGVLAHPQIARRLLALLARGDLVPRGADGRGPRAAAHARGDAMALVVQTQGPARRRGRDIRAGGRRDEGEDRQGHATPPRANAPAPGARAGNAAHFFY